MNNSIENSKKEERRKNERRQLIQMTLIISIIFISLFVFISFSDALDKEIQQNDCSTEEESLSMDNVTYDETETELVETERSEESKTIESSTESHTEIHIETTAAFVMKTTELPKYVNNYTDDDLYYLAAAVCCEAGGESEEIQLLVANVVINRVNSPLFPNTIYGVLTQYKQYGMMWKYGVSFPTWANQNTIDHCYAIAKRILDGERVCPENVLFQAEFVQGSGIFKQFGDKFYFCYYD